MLKRKIGTLLLMATLVMTNTMSVYAGTALNLAEKTANKYGISADNQSLGSTKKAQVLSAMQTAYAKENNKMDYLNPIDVTELSNLKATDYALVLEGTGLQGYGYAFEKAETEYGINGVFLLSLCALESGWGSSYAAINKNNCAGIMGSNGTRRFTSLEECILYTANLLSTKYVSEDGPYYRGGQSIYNINTLYCVKIDWAAKIIDIGNTVSNTIVELKTN